MTTFISRSLVATAVALSLLSATAGAGAATLANGSFGAGLGSWTTSGNVAVDTASNFGATPAPATAQAVLGTAEAGAFLFGGAVASAATLETFTGVATGTFSGMGAVVGSALSQSFSTIGNELLQLRWKFMTNEPQTNSPANDTAFMVLDGVLSKLTTVKTAALLGGSASPLLDETAYASFSAPLAAGNHTLSLGIFDVPDASGASALAVTGITTVPVPEPAGWALALGGAGLLGVLRRRRG